MNRMTATLAAGRSDVKDDIGLHRNGDNPLNVKGVTA
jgi:hypothetical protein